MKRNTLNLKDMILPPGSPLSDTEVATIMFMFYQIAHHVSANEVHFVEPNLTDADYIFSLKYSSNHIESILAGPGYTSKKLDDLLNRIQTAVELEAGVSVHRTALFSVFPIKGYFRSGDFFQIRPMPDDAPKPIAEIYGNNPLLLETKYQANFDLDVVLSRVDERANEVGVLLHALLEGDILMPKRYPGYEWVIQEYPGRDAIITQSQLGYPKSFTVDEPHEFSTIAQWRSMRQVNAQDYYTRRKGWGGDIELEIPDDLDSSIKCFQALTRDEHRIFLLACYWLYTSTEIKRYSQSSSYVAIVSAVESLIPELVKTPRCPTCGSELHKPTRLFKDFLELFAPDKSSRNAKDALYSMRSKLVHGKSSFVMDFPGALFDPSPIHNAEQRRFLAIRPLVKLALRNWLHMAEARLEFKSYVEQLSNPPQ